MTKTELWDYMTQEVREYMGMRYFQTTRCLLTAEQIDQICESEIIAIESSPSYMDYKKQQEEAESVAYLSSLGLAKGDKVTLHLHEWRNDTIHCFQVDQKCDCILQGLQKGVPILTKGKKEIRFRSSSAWSLLKDGIVYLEHIEHQTILPNTYTDEQLARLRINLLELQKL